MLTSARIGGRDQYVQDVQLQAEAAETLGLRVSHGRWLEALASTKLIAF